MRFKSYLISCLFILVSLSLQAKPFTVVLDPGHGGKDPGACGKTSYEKNIVLSVAQKVGKKLTDTYGKDIKVIYTRNSDVFIELERRARIANDAHADIFVSIHTDAVDRSTVYGASTFTMGMSKESSNLEVAKRENSVMLLEDNFEERYAGFDPSSVESYIIFELMQDINMENSISLAKNIQNNFISKKRHNRGVRQAPYWVLHRTSMPSVLVELGFISNPEEERYMKSAKGQEELSDCIYQAICKYKRACDNKSSGMQTMLEPSSVADVSEASNQALSYRVQILVSKSELKHNDRQFKKLNDVSYYKDKSLYKYTSGIFATEAEAQAHRRSIKNLFPDAFVVAIKDGKRITMDEARQIQAGNKK